MEASGLVTGTAIWSTFSQWSSSPNPHAAQGSGPRPGGGSLCHCFLRRCHERWCSPSKPLVLPFSESCLLRIQPAKGSSCGCPQKYFLQGPSFLGEQRCSCPRGPGPEFLGPLLLCGDEEASVAPSGTASPLELWTRWMLRPLYQASSLLGSQLLKDRDVM